MRPVPVLALILALTACADDRRGGPGQADAAEPERGPAVAVPGFAFRDVTAEVGLGGVTHFSGAAGRRHYVETMGPGVAVFDADGDGDLDVYLVDGAPLPGTPAGAAPGNRLFVNRGDGGFTEARGFGADDPGYGMGVAVGDADGDGDPDLYVLNYGPNAFYRNDGAGRFTRVEVGAEDPAWSVSGAFFDADGDGDLDLYVANYLDYDVAREGPCRAGTLEIYCSPEQFPPASDRFYRNRGDGRFVDATAEVGLVEGGRGMGVVPSDLDLDGDTDLYVTNDRTPNFLYRNDGGRFVEVAAESGVAYGPTGSAEGGMGVVAADLMGVGRPAIFLTNFQKEPNRLYAPAADGFFDDLSTRSGLGFDSAELVGWGVAAIDVEGDTDLDLVVANGHVFDNAAEFIPGSAFALADRLYRNDGSGRFSAEVFPGPPASSRGLAVGDLDGDGDPDLVVGAAQGPLRVWRNEEGSPERFLVLDLVGRPPNASAYGAVVEARVGSAVLRREVTGGDSYASHSSPRLYLGLGDAGVAASLTVRWPDGTVERLPETTGGRRLVWRQGEGIVGEAALAEARRPR